MKVYSWTLVLLSMILYLAVLFAFVDGWYDFVKKSKYHEKNPLTEEELIGRPELFHEKRYIID